MRKRPSTPDLAEQRRSHEQLMRIAREFMQNAEHPLSEEEILALYADAGEVPTYIRDLFGERHLRAIQDAFEDPTMLEVDFLLLNGSLKLEEAAEYAQSLPELRDVMDASTKPPTSSSATWRNARSSAGRSANPSLHTDG